MTFNLARTSPQNHQANKDGKLCYGDVGFSLLDFSKIGRACLGYAVISGHQDLSISR